MESLHERFRRLAARVPDTPPTLELRAMLLTATGDLVEEGCGFVVTDGARHLAAAWGRPSARATARIAASLGGPGPAVLCVPGDLEGVRAALPGWHVEEARLYELASLPERKPGPEVRSLPKEISLEHLPTALREEISRALAEGREVLSRFVGPIPVTFAYTPWVTETLEDVSIDTLEPFRRRGFAEETVAALLLRIRERGRRPIWGALESNVASNALGRKLGFRRAGELFVVQRPR